MDYLEEKPKRRSVFVEFNQKIQGPPHSIYFKMATEPISPLTFWIKWKKLKEEFGKEGGRKEEGQDKKEKNIKKNETKGRREIIKSYFKGIIHKICPFWFPISVIIVLLILKFYWELGFNIINFSQTNEKLNGILNGFVLIILEMGVINPIIFLFFYTFILTIDFEKALGNIFYSVSKENSKEWEEWKEWSESLKKIWEDVGDKVVPKWITPFADVLVWTGTKTKAFFHYLKNPNEDVLGRSKWLLVNFLQTDIEKKIERLEERNGDNNTSESGIDNGKPIFRLTVHDWDTQTYSQFLAENMHNAQESIYWVVDVFDLIMEIIPAMLVEVFVSIGEILKKEFSAVIMKGGKTLEEYLKNDKKINDKDKDEKKEKGKNPDNLSDNFYDNLLGNLYDLACSVKLREFCPYGENGVKVCENPCTPENGFSRVYCGYYFTDKNLPVYNQFMLIWYPVLRASIKLLDNSDCVFVKDGKLIIRREGENGGKEEKEISWEDIREKYICREDFIGGLVLRHIDEFRKFENKKRHIFLGPVKSGIFSYTDKKVRGEELYKVGVNNIKGCFSKKTGVERFEYIKNFDPTLGISYDKKEKVFRFKSLKFQVEKEKIRVIENERKEKFFEKMEKDVERLLIKWCLKLFDYTSSKKGSRDYGVIKGVFGTQDLRSILSYYVSHDKGYYDSKLLLSSARVGKEVNSSGNKGFRDISWEIFNGPAKNLGFYFPDANEKNGQNWKTGHGASEGQNRLIDYPLLEKIIIDGLVGEAGNINNGVPES